MSADSEEWDGKRQGAGCRPESRERRQDKRGTHGVQPQGDDVKNKNHLGGPRRPSHPRGGGGGGAGGGIQDGIFRMSRTGTPGTRFGCSMLRINPDAE
jgi:hypothetical protein